MRLLGNTPCLEKEIVNTSKGWCLINLLALSSTETTETFFFMLLFIASIINSIWMDHYRKKNNIPLKKFMIPIVISCVVAFILLGIIINVIVLGFLSQSQHH